MEACELIRLILNKVTIPAEPKRRWKPRLRTQNRNPSPRILKAKRTRKRHTHNRAPKKTPARCPKTWTPHHTRQNNHWPMVDTLPSHARRSHEHNRRIIKDNIPTTHLIVDSTPLKDMYDIEAKWGFTCRGPVKGFKLHVAVNQLGLPLRAIMTPANRL